MSGTDSEVNIEDPRSLLPYLRERRFIAGDECPRFEVLSGGVSNRTVLVQRAHGEDWVLKQALAKLRVQVDWYSSPERIHIEAKGLRWLGKVLESAVPRFVFEDKDHHVLCMTAALSPHENWKVALLQGKTSVRHARSFARLLARIHNAIAEFSELRDEFSERRYFEELRLEPYYGFTASQVPNAAAFLRALIHETRERQYALTHGDYSPKNILLHDDRLILLDHEVIHFGDPAFDVGFSLAHFLGKALHLPSFRAEFLRMARAYWQTYLGDLSPQLVAAVREPAVKHTLACTLARAAGRSPLEYLDAAERQDLQALALTLIDNRPADIDELIDQAERFLEGVHDQD